MTTPHLTELLDLTAVVDHVTRVHVSDMLRAGNASIPPPTEDQISETLAAMRVVDRNLLRSSVLRLVYPGAREIAEQAYERALDSARAGTPLECEANPFAEGAVTI